jgi:hypothetical protein
MPIMAGRSAAQMILSHRRARSSSAAIYSAAAQSQPVTPIRSGSHQAGTDNQPATQSPIVIASHEYPISRAMLSSAV